MGIVPTVLLQYCAGKGLDVEAGRSGKGLWFPEELSSGQSQSPGWFSSAEARPGERSYSLLCSHHHVFFILIDSGFLLPPWAVPELQPAIPISQSPSGLQLPAPSAAPPAVPATW